MKGRDKMWIWEKIRKLLKRKKDDDPVISETRVLSEEELRELEEKISGDEYYDGWNSIH